MGIYFDIIRFNFLRFLAYPLEIWAAIIKRVINVGFLVVFWSIVARSSQGTINFVPLISYFLISSSVNDVISAEAQRFGKYIGDLVKHGAFNTYLIRPLSLIPYLYSSCLGERSLSLILSAIIFILGIIISPPSGVLSVALFIVFLSLAVVISLSINLMVGILHFYTPEASNFRYTISHVIKVFSGAIVPLSFFPDSFRWIVQLSPFPGMVYAPVTSLHITSLSPAVWQSLAVNAAWAVVLLAIAVMWWKKAIKHYDAVGI